MLTDIRWQKEQELVESVFPEFRPFMRGPRFGFEGRLRGHRSGCLYEVVLEAEQATYPQLPPSVAMHPQIGVHWIGDLGKRRLCMEREWRPARSTFANTLLAVIRYLDEHDPEPGAGPHPLRRGQGPGCEWETGDPRELPPIPCRWRTPRLW